MASTNEDAVALAASRFDYGRVLLVRHLPDRGTVEIGWWRWDEGGAIAQAPPVLELAAEAVEVNAFARLCEQVAAAGWETIGDGEEIAAAGPFADGARLAALRSGQEVKLIRYPERDNLILLSRAALDVLIAEMLTQAVRKLEVLGFGLVQQEGQAVPTPTEGHA
jgi:hypothetical protein